MKANELRIGNYLVNFLGQEFQVNIETLRLLDEGGIGCEFPLPNPIPLTEEWLLRFGFIEKNSWFYKNEFLLGYMTTDSNLQAEWKFSGVEGMFNLLEIKYVHQLQNLYFALTGVEIEIIN